MACGRIAMLPGFFRSLRSRDARLSCVRVDWTLVISGAVSIAARNRRPDGGGASPRCQP